MPAVNIEALNFEGIHLTADDFEPGKDNATVISQGEVGEVGKAEIGKDGQLSAFDALRLGDSLDPTGQSPKGKIFADVYDDVPAAVDERTQFRFIVRDKNSNRRQPLTRWYAVRDLNVSDTRQRTPISPVTQGEKPWYVKNGRYVAIEARNNAQDVTVDITQSTVEVPARGGY